MPIFRPSSFKASCRCWHPQSPPTMADTRSFVMPTAERTFSTISPSPSFFAERKHPGDPQQLRANPGADSLRLHVVQTPLASNWQSLPKESWLSM